MKTHVTEVLLPLALISSLALMLACGVTAQTFTTLYSFTAVPPVDATNSDGAVPVAGLIASNHIVYGTAESGGISGKGTVFRMNSDGTGFTNLHSFTQTSGPNPSTNSDGANPQARLVFGGTTLYGTAYQGGASGNGTVSGSTPTAQALQIFTVSRQSRAVSPMILIEMESGRRLD